MPGPFFFAWVPAPIAYDSTVHAVEDEEIVSLSITQSEGDFAGLNIVVRNPFYGLLAPTRHQWCWLSWYDGAAYVPLFHGRLIAFPESIDGEAVALLFSAKPPNFDSIKATYAETLKVLPFWDPIWITGDTENPDTVLNAYGCRWHIDRRTLALTHSDEVTGEDGTISVGDADHLYDAFSASYSNPPLSRVDIEGSLGWTQSGTGTIDLTWNVYDICLFQKSIYTHPKAGVISSLTGEGLMSDWPKPGTTIDGGWKVNDATGAFEAPKSFKRYNYHVEYRQVNTDPADPERATTNLAYYYFGAEGDYQVDFPVSAIQQFTLFDWEADRKRTETFKCSLYADIQPLLAEPDNEENVGSIKISASDTVTEPDGSGNMAIGDTRRTSYMNTDRGALSVQYLLLLARTELRRSARAIEISCRVPWHIGVGATLRQNAHITDYRLPGGEADGKIISYELAAAGTGEMSVGLTIGCTIGHDGTVSAADGETTYVELGYVDAGYQQMTGAEIMLPTDDLVYQSLDGFAVNDDGVDLFNINETTAVLSLGLTGGMDTQTQVVEAVSDPIDALRQYPTRICVTLVPVAGQNFDTVYAPDVQPLPIPKRIDLEAPAPGLARAA
jgi:hypothetical protein